MDDHSDPNQPPKELTEAHNRLLVAKDRLDWAQRALNSVNTRKPQPLARLTTTITVADKAGTTPSLVTPKLLSGPNPSATVTHQRLAQSPSISRPPAVQPTLHNNRVNY